MNKTELEGTAHLLDELDSKFWIFLSNNVSNSSRKTHGFVT